MLPSTRQEARAAGVRHYFTGKPCSRGHTALRELRGHCVECRREDNHKPENRAARKAYAVSEKGQAAAARCADKIKKDPARKAKYAEKTKRWAEKNHEKRKEIYRNYYLRNKEKNLKYVKEWRRKNKERHKNTYKNWVEDNRDVVREHHKKRYYLRKQASLIPASHKNLVVFMYKMGADLGLQVDHIVPLNHKEVCGLHTFLNLRLLSPELNNKKNNSFGGDGACI